MVRHGTELRGEIQRLTPHGVEFKDGSTFACDAIIAATGYRSDNFSILRGEGGKGGEYKQQQQQQQQHDEDTGSMAREGGGGKEAMHGRRGGAKNMGMGGRGGGGAADAGEIAPETVRRGLFKHMFSPRWRERMAFIGFARPGFGAIPPISELQARYWALLVAGKRVLPPHDTMIMTMELDADVAVRFKELE